MADKNKFDIGDIIRIKTTDELVTVNKWHYVKNMKEYSYTVKEHPSTFYFENELRSK
ncbi:hypothetical protein [Jeotgalibacillus soli]|uniref:Uncharacterized protein n=1 Tax=Jeotgalibacillus soli TaxID=889306 RepID=A0A0C2S9J1_9BACL|nr:hypothetical protein [Jeotgalibacillus soli]KIL50624.1 hypothetical protein KP78_06250 [Jeotgalibacillus soli]